MKLSELMGKEIVNIYDGARLGTIGDSDLMIDAASGEVDAIILPGRGILNYRPDKHQMVIPWESVRKIGNEVIIVELNQARTRARGY